MWGVEGGGRLRILLNSLHSCSQCEWFTRIPSRFCSIDHDYFCHLKVITFHCVILQMIQETTNRVQFLLAPAWLIGEELLCKKQQITGEEEMLVPLWINKDPQGNAPRRKKWIQFAV